MKKVMIFSVHPDDETIGAGGTILKLLNKGVEVHWVLMTKMDPNMFSPESIKERDKVISEVQKFYSGIYLHQFPFYTTKLDACPKGELVNSISQLVSKITPDTVFIPFGGDIHTDHKIAYEVLASLTKNFRYPFIKKVLAMEVLSESNFGHMSSVTTFFPNYYIEISENIDQKMHVIDFYKGEFLPHPFARSKEAIRALSIVRGSEINVSNAEAFQIIKMVDEL
jgi:LmbE family N-acetylglucosaminyl deacetylase